MLKKAACTIVLLLTPLLGSTANVAAQDKVSVKTGVDFYSRYVWRGADIANTPSIQPTLAVDYAGIEMGIWGAYTMSNQTSVSDEIDFWLSYTKEIESGIGIKAVVTDYYYPNAGIDFFNFNSYDAVRDDSIPNPGAHTIEIGLSITGPKSFPITISGYVNAYNDAGNNTYFQADYPLSVGKTDLGFFCGIAGGSKDNPGYYGTDKLNVINMGLAAVREVHVSDNLSVPLTVSFIVNPKVEISYLIVGLSF